MVECYGMDASLICFLKVSTVRDIPFGTGHYFWDSGYLCHFSTEMAQIWFSDTHQRDV